MRLFNLAFSIFPTYNCSLRNDYGFPNLVITLFEACTLIHKYTCIFWPDHSHKLVTPDLQGHCSRPDLTASHCKQVGKHLLSVDSRSPLKRQSDVKIGSISKPLLPLSFIVETYSCSFTLPE